MTIEEALDLLEYGDWFQSVYNNLPESTANKVAEAIEALAKVVHSDHTSEPLSLEQLREMDGKPVFVKMKTIHELTGWAIVHVDYQMGAIRLWGKTGNWLRYQTDDMEIYAYHPVHIDRKKWEPCECCREPIGAEPYAKEKYPGICDFEVILDGGDEIAVNAYNHYTPVTEEVCFSFPVSFCPKCGRPLTDQAWAELEKRLRG